MDLPPKICPECRVEYVHTAVECSDCHVPLVAADALPEAADDRLADLEQLTPIRVESGSWISRLAVRLREEGIAHRVDPAPARRGAHSGPLFALFVRSEDAEAARAVDAEVLRSELPELPDLPGTPSAPASDEACPACGCQAPPDVSECPDCGLNFEPA